ncbi:MAG: hypothetical protein ACYTF0_05800, partial [Planctomycetota bacterium]|jgi:transcriptional regulator with XRE-family HTH domain
VATLREKDEDEDLRHLGQIVADTIQIRRESIGAFARDLGISYLVLSAFLEQGKVPPEKVLETLRSALDLEGDLFETALERNQSDTQTAVFAARSEVLGIDANPLQRAMVAYMGKNNLTLKALAGKAGLSQVTISRLVKQGQAPTRATTHIKLQELLALKPEEYQDLLVDQPASKKTSGGSGSGSARLPALQSNGAQDDSDDSIRPDCLSEMSLEELGIDPDNPPKRDDLVGMVKNLDDRQREAVRRFLADLT